MEDHQATTDGGGGRPADEPDERTPPLVPPEEPTGDDPRDGRPAGMKGRVGIPEDTRGHYVVLWAPKPARGHRAAFEEVACVKAHDPDHAKRIVLEEDGRATKPVAERGDVARWLLERAGEKPGILLRAVPAMHWPQDVPTTSFVRPEPVLSIG